MRYLYTKSEHYRKFLKENKTDRVSKGYKILPEGDKGFLFKSDSIQEEIFNTVLDTKYTISNINNRIKILFNTNSGTKYRIDIYPIQEFGKLINHLAFTEENSKFDEVPKSGEEFIEYEDEYTKPTNRNEMIELMNRIHFILKDLVDNGKVNNSFCIGGTEIESKNSIYEYLLRVVVGKDGFKKLNTEVYPKVGWGLYFSI